MDFFDHQDRARRRTGILIFYFVVAVVAIVALVHLTVITLFVVQGRPDGTVSPAVFLELVLDPELLATVASVTVLVVIFGMMKRIGELRDGGRVVAENLGGRQIDSDTVDPEERMLLNVVEEMSLASGVPVPLVFILDEEEGVNAFAAGFSAEDAVIGVTRGALRRFDRHELQGVIAHEFSHILNGDMRLNIRLMGVIAGITAISAIGEVLFRRSSRSHHSPSYRRSSSSNKEGAILVVFGLALFVIGWIGYFFGSLIQAAVSRQREFLADASAVQFTRDPGTIGSALRKILYGSGGTVIDHPRGREVGHLMFGDVVKRWLTAFATHPPLEERIRRITTGSLQSESLPPPYQAAVSPVSGGTGKPAGPVSGLAPSKAVALDADAALAAIGNPQQHHLHHVRTLKSGLSAGLMNRVRNHESARAVIYGLLLDKNPQIRTRQFEILRQSAEPGLADQCYGVVDELDRIPDEVRLTLVDLVTPQLRGLDKARRRRMHAVTRALIGADDRVTLFEFALFRLLERRLFPDLEGNDGGGSAFKAKKRDLINVLSALARAGSEDDEQRRSAFRAGIAAIGLSGAEMVETPGAGMSIQALDRLSRLVPWAKKKVVDACIRTVAADERFTTSEAELLRAVCAILSCPMPPWIPQKGRFES